MRSCAFQKVKASSQVVYCARIIIEMQTRVGTRSRSAELKVKQFKAQVGPKGNIKAMPFQQPLPQKLIIHLAASGDPEVDRRVIGRACYYSDLMDTFGRTRKYLNSGDAMRCIKEIVEEEGVTVEVAKQIIKRFRARVTKGSRKYGVAQKELIQYYKKLSGV